MLSQEDQESQSNPGDEGDKSQEDQESQSNPRHEGDKARRSRKSSNPGMKAIKPRRSEAK